MKKDKLSIIVVNYNTKELLRECLYSIIKDVKGISCETIVVDNSSNDGSAEMVEKYFPDVKLIANDSNLGFAKANNQGIKVSKGNYILLLNSDTVILPNSLEKLLNFIENHPRVGVVSPALLNPDLTPQPFIHELPNLWRTFLHFFNFKRLAVSPQKRHFLAKLLKPIADKNINAYLACYRTRLEPKSVEMVNGTCFLIRKQVIDQVGLLDEEIFLYCEDADWCKRIKEAGWDIYFLPNIKIIHYGGESIKKAFGLVSLARYKGTLYYYKKHKNKISVLTLRIIAISGLSFKLLSLIIKYLFSERKNKESIKKSMNLHTEVIHFFLNSNRFT